MAPHSPSGHQKPPNQMQKKRLSKSHTTIQESAQDHIPIATNLQKGVEITVAKNCQGTSKIPQGDPGSNNKIPLHEDCSPSQGIPPHQKSFISTVEIISNDQLKNSGDTKVTKNGVPANQNESAWYQNARIDEENSLASLYRYQSTTSILQSLIPGILTPPGA